MHELGIAAPLFRDDLTTGQIVLDAIRIGIGLVDLVDRHDDGDTRRLGVLDGFLGLRHDAVIGRDDQDDDVGAWHHGHASR